LKQTARREKDIRKREAEAWVHVQARKREKRREEKKEERKGSVFY
jgi:hypothetical protein